MSEAIQEGNEMSRALAEHGALATTEPVAVVGIGCRFPGNVGSPEEFWQLLAAGRCTVEDVPVERWESYRNLGPEYAAAVRRAIGFGNYLHEIDSFDAEFFGISPREAELMDPQQRVLLEVAWQALEHSGISPASLAGTDTSVFAGVCTYDYGARQLEDLPGIDAWTGIGAATCAVANRISHALDLRGPSLSMDTACSASLVAVHLACQSLRLGESTVALACGVNLIVSPGQTLTLGAAGALAADGRSKSFDASADGYGRGEGCGVLVLKRLVDAQRDGDRVLAVVLGSAVNQDGHTEGIMAPCGQAQGHVMRRALRCAGIEPSSVDYVEAHGTGTRLGDPIEAAAISAVFGTARPPNEPCLIGSVKSNIGHSEGAAGVAGMIKAILALDHGEIPRTLLATEITPTVRWLDSGVRLATEHMPWPRRAHPRRSGVSGFGYGGTVAHVILEQAPTDVAAGEPDEPDDQIRVFVVSASSPPALRDRAKALADEVTVAGDAWSLAALSDTLARRRTHLGQRAGIVATNRGELVERLLGLATGVPTSGVVTAARKREHMSLVWVFSGHGSQWAGMGHDLLKAEPVFARVIDDLETVFTQEIGFSPRQALIKGDFASVEEAQAMLFAMQVALAEVWRSRGVTPDLVIGHSVGEIAAATVAGVLTRSDAARLVCRRSLLLRKVAGRGAMAMVTLPFGTVVDRLAGRTDVAAAIAAAPQSTVVSGDPSAIDELMTTWAQEGIEMRKINSNVAFHSPQMDPLLGDLAAAVSDLPHYPASIPMLSTTMEDPHAPITADSAYWAANLRNPVRLTAAIEAAAKAGHRAFLEISPHPVVMHSILETLAELGLDEDTFVGMSLRRNEPELPRLLTSLAEAHCNGVFVDWSAAYRHYPPVTLPGYPWQQRRHWREPATRTSAGGRGHEVASRTLIGTPTSIAGSAVRVWRTSLADDSRPYPGSHALNGVEIVPAAVLVTTFFAASASEGGPLALFDLAMRHPVMTSDRRDIQVVLEGSCVRLASRTIDSSESTAEEGPAWLMHADAVVADGDAMIASLASMALVDPAAARLNPADPGLVARRLTDVGVPSTGFDWTIEELRRGKNILRARVFASETATWAPVLDAVMSIAPAVFPGQPMLRMVAHIDQVVVAEPQPPETVVIEVSLDPDRQDTANALVADDKGVVIASLQGLRYPVIDLPPAPTDHGKTGMSEADADRLASMSADELHAWVRAEVCDQIATEMRLPVADLNTRRPLVELGMDSILKMVIRRRLEKRFGLSLSATVFWKRPTIDALIEHLLEALKVLPAAGPGHPAGGATASGHLERSQHEPSLSSIRTHTLRVPGARLHYEVYGNGPTLLLIPGGAADSTIFAGVREMLAEYYTVVTYDPRGISLSPLGSPLPEQGLIRTNADDVQRLLAEIGAGPAYVFAHSGGAITAMDHVVRHYDQVRTLVLYEPTVISYLDPSVLVGPDMPTIYREQGVQAALAKFTDMTGLDVAPRPANPSPDMLLQMNRMSDNLAYSFLHLMPAMIEFVPDLDALSAIPTRIVVGVGVKSAEQPAHKAALLLAANLGLPAVSFPSNHAGFVFEPVEFALRLREVLDQSAEKGIDTLSPQFVISERP
jgi:acyl transferase domain-containing protein/pimeloyl-ACP methyl ester carboxylesterase/acyl carrier protein